MAALVLHINREMLHHGAEIALLRDLFHWNLSDIAFDATYDAVRERRRSGTT
jgi:hypothetical protein